MPIGVLTNCAAVLLGGLLEHILEDSPAGLKDNLPTLFGFCSIAIGVNSIIKASGMTAVVLAILVGFTIGHGLHFGAMDEQILPQAGAHPPPRRREHRHGVLHHGGRAVLLFRLWMVQHSDRGHHRRSKPIDVQGCS